MLTLQKAELDDTADLYISLAKNTSITGQSMAVGEFMLFCACEEDKLTGNNDRRRLRYSLNSQRLHSTNTYIYTYTARSKPVGLCLKLSMSNLGIIVLYKGI